MTVISEYYKSGGGSAQVRQNEKDEYFVLYFDEKGNVIDSEKFPGKSVHYVEDAAENWALGIKE